MHKPFGIRVPAADDKHYYVALRDLVDAKKTLLPIYTRDGRLWTDTAAGERALRASEATRLHRDNIITHHYPEDF